MTIKGKGLDSSTLHRESWAHWDSTEINAREAIWSVKNVCSDSPWARVNSDHILSWMHWKEGGSMGFDMLN